MDVIHNPLQSPNWMTGPEFLLRVLRRSPVLLLVLESSVATAPTFDHDRLELYPLSIDHEYEYEHRNAEYEYEYERGTRVTLAAKCEHPHTAE